MSRPFAFLLLGLASCAAPGGSLGLLAPDANGVGVKLLRPGARARTCRTSVLGIALGGPELPLDAAVAQLLALDPEGNVVTGVEIRSSAVVTGLYNRRCVELRGDLGRFVPTITLPVPSGHRAHVGR
jgi:hypothetical protein